MHVGKYAYVTIRGLQENNRGLYRVKVRINKRDLFSASRFNTLVKIWQLLIAVYALLDANVC